MRFRTLLETSGTGLWSSARREVGCKSIDLICLDEDWERNYGPFGEVRVAVLRKDWKTERHGLIYTDPRWLIGLKAELRSRGFTDHSLRDLDYSEQGMQGDDYVSLDAGPKFIRKWRKLGWHELKSHPRLSIP